MTSPRLFYAHCLLFAAAFLLAPGSFMPTVNAIDCNTNGVEDATDITNGTSQDCDLNTVPDECQPDSDSDGAIDACDNCGNQLTDNNNNQFWGLRQSITADGKVLWFDDQDAVIYYDGTQANTLQTRIDNANNDLGAIADFVFALGSGANEGQVVAGWRRGTDFAWVWTNNGEAPKLVQATNPYDATRPMNPEGIAVADGCVFIVFQASDPNTNSLIKHIYKVDPATGQSTFLTEDFLGDTQTGGSGADPVTIRTSGCLAAWSWCHDGSNGTCNANAVLDLQLYDGTAVTVIDTDGLPLSFAMGRLIYSKPVNGIQQLFLYDTNLEDPSPVQLTTFSASDKKLIFAQTDGRHVGILVGDDNGKNREIILLGGLKVTNSTTQPADNPPNPLFPFQLQRGQLLWTAQNTSTIYFDGQTKRTVCNDGWLADGFIAQLRKSSASGADSEVWRATGVPPNDDQQPTAPIQQVITQNNNQATVEFDQILGANSYNVYYAQEAGVDSSNYNTLEGGNVVTNVTSSPVTIQNLEGDKQYFFIVVAVEGTNIGPKSNETNIMPCTDSALDGDNDGVPDCADDCPSDPEKTAPGLCGCGNPETDTDTDGTPDCNDACPNDPDKTEVGICGCGVPEADTDSDGTPNCEDDCANDPDKTVPGDCGCGVADVDVDTDNIPDCIDEDVAGENPEPPAACGACGAGAAPFMMLMMVAFAFVKWSWRRNQKQDE